MTWLRTVDDARNYLLEFQKHLIFGDCYVKLLCEGRDGRPLARDVKPGEYWTDEEANALFLRACHELDLPEAKVRRWMGDAPDQREMLGQACDMMGMTPPGRERLMRAFDRRLKFRSRAPH